MIFSCEILLAIEGIGLSCLVCINRQFCLEMAIAGLVTADSFRALEFLALTIVLFVNTAACYFVIQSQVTAAYCADRSHLVAKTPDRKAQGKDHEVKTYGTSSQPN